MIGQSRRILFVVYKLNQANFIPLGLASLIGMLQANGHDVHLICPQQDNLGAEMEAFHPEVVGYSVLTGSHSQYLEMNHHLKKRYEFLSLFGGPHPTFFPEMIEEDGVDAVCIGEGELALVDFLNRLGTDDLIRTENFWVKQKDIIYRNPVRPLSQRLDDFPLPNYEIFYQNFQNFWENPIKHFLVSRGCPYDCTYCFNHSYSQIYQDKGKRVRHKSPAYVVKEIKSVIERFPAECIYFRDDIFVASNAWLDEFTPMYKREIGLPFICQLRVEMVNEPLIKRLILAGCVSISLGLETGNENFRREILNRVMSNEQVLEACKIIKQEGLPFCINNMVGLPGETLENLYETLALTQKIKPSYSWFQIFQPYPKTPLAEYACTQELFNGDYDRVYQSCHEKTALRFPKKQQRIVNNSHKLFALAVEWPWLSGLVKWLITLPENIIYITLFAVGQYYYTTSRLFPMLKMTTGDWIRGFWRTILVTQPSLNKPKPELITGHNLAP